MKAAATRADGAALLIAIAIAWLSAQGTSAQAPMPATPVCDTLRAKTFQEREDWIASMGFAPAEGEALKRRCMTDHFDDLKRQEEARQKASGKK